MLDSDKAIAEAIINKIDETDWQYYSVNILFIKEISYLFSQLILWYIILTIKDMFIITYHFK